MPPAVQLGNSPYFGGIVGRVANRIANGTFQLDGQTFTTDKNDRGNTLHGGFNPFFENNTWTIQDASDNEVTLTLLSPDGTQVLAHLQALLPLAPIALPVYLTHRLWKIVMQGVLCAGCC